MPIFNDYANGKPLKEIDYFIDKIYVDDDGNLSFVIKRYGKDGTELVEMSAEELIENQGFTVFDNFALCSTQSLADQRLQGFFVPAFHLCGACRSCAETLGEIPQGFSFVLCAPGTGRNRQMTGRQQFS